MALNEKENKAEAFKRRVNEVFELLMQGDKVNEENKSPSFQLYVQHFLVGTMNMSHIEAWGYTLLLLHQWDKYGLDNDPDELQTLAKCDNKTISVIIRKFTTCKDGKMRNRKLEKIRAEQIVFREIKSKAGKRAADSRWNPIDEKTESEPLTKPKYESKQPRQYVTLDHLDNSEKIQLLSKNNDVPIEQIYTWLEDFKKNRENDNREYKTVADLRDHFGNYCRSQKEKKTLHVDKAGRSQCPYSNEQLRIADAHVASGHGVPEWFDKKWKHLLTN